MSDRLRNQGAAIEFPNKSAAVVLFRWERLKPCPKLYVSILSPRGGQQIWTRMYYGPKYPQLANIVFLSKVGETLRQITCGRAARRHQAVVAALGAGRGTRPQEGFWLASNAFPLEQPLLSKAAISRA